VTLPLALAALAWDNRSPKRIKANRDEHRATMADIRASENERHAETALIRAELYERDGDAEAAQRARDDATELFAEAKALRRAAPPPL
jgi:hypothetical protein